MCFCLHAGLQGLDNSHTRASIMLRFGSQLKSGIKEVHNSRCPRALGLLLINCSPMRKNQKSHTSLVKVLLFRMQWRGPIWLLTSIQDLHEMSLDSSSGLFKCMSVWWPPLIGLITVIACLCLVFPFLFCQPVFCKRWRRDLSQDTHEMYVKIFQRQMLFRQKQLCRSLLTLETTHLSYDEIDWLSSVFGRSSWGHATSPNSMSDLEHSDWASRWSPRPALVSTVVCLWSTTHPPFGQRHML